MTEKYAVFDFDGTISTLRCGWEHIMETLMLESLSGQSDPERARQVQTYIERSTGTPTICQMQWLAGQVQLCTGQSRSAEYYKEQYNHRLMEMVGEKRSSLKAGLCLPQDHMVPGAGAFLQLLKDRGWHLVLASGTDEEDVKLEAALLGIEPLFDGIFGAPRPKDQVLDMLIRQVPQGKFAVIGDGTAEISMARDRKILAIGIASDEVLRRGIDLRKKSRLERAGADVIFGDFTQADRLLTAMEEEIER